MSEKQVKTLTKKDVVGSFWRWTFFSHANYNYERLAATGFVHAMAPIIFNVIWHKHVWLHKISVTKQTSP